MNDLSASFADPGRRAARFTADEFLPIAGAAASLDIRLELADGTLERMSPPSDGHSHHQTLTMTRLVLALGEAASDLLRIEVGVHLAPGTIRVPDLLILREPGRVEGVRDAGAVRLVIEVAETALETDLGVKRVEYARADIPHYWVVDVRARVVNVFAEPTNDGYLEKSEMAFADRLAVPGTDAAITLA